MALTLVSPPAVEPLSLDEAKDHLRVEVADDDLLITSLIAAARQQAEAITRRALVTQTWELTLRGFPCRELYLPFAPLQSVASVTYLDTSGAQQTWPSDQYTVVASSGPWAQPGWLEPAYGVAYPSTLDAPNAVTVRFVAGYGDAASDVPQAIRQALLLMLGHWYEHRELVVVGTSVIELPQSAEWLLWPYRVLDERVSV